MTHDTRVVRVCATDPSLGINYDVLWVLDNVRFQSLVHAPRTDRRHLYYVRYLLPDYVRPLISALHVHSLGVSNNSQTIPAGFLPLSAV